MNTGKQSFFFFSFAVKLQQQHSVYIFSFSWPPPSLKRKNHLLWMQSEYQMTFDQRKSPLKKKKALQGGATSPLTNPLEPQSPCMGIVSKEYLMRISVSFFWWLLLLQPKYNCYVVLPPRQIKSTVRLCRRIKNRRRQIQTFDLNNN